jgi:hypothetical protein
MGTPHALGTLTTTHADVQINGRIIFDDIEYKTRGEYDYHDVGIDTSSPGTPKTFGGVSGRGLWLVHAYCSCSTGGIDWNLSLEGVAFYELPDENDRVVIRCHGPKSISAGLQLANTQG